MDEKAQEALPGNESLLAQLQKPVILRYPVEREKGSSKEKTREEIREVKFSGLGADLYLYAASLPGGTEAFQAKLGPGRPSGERKLSATVQHCYPSLPPELQTAIIDKAMATLQQEQIDPGDHRVSLFQFFQLQGPAIIAEVSQGEEKELEVPAGKRLVDEGKFQEVIKQAVDAQTITQELERELAATKRQLEQVQKPEGQQWVELQAENRELQRTIEELTTSRKIEHQSLVQEGENLFLENERNRKPIVLRKHLGSGRYGEVWLADVAEGEFFASDEEGKGKDAKPLTSVVVKIENPGLSAKDKSTFDQEFYEHLPAMYNYIKREGLAIDNHLFIPDVLGAGTGFSKLCIMD